MAQAVLELYPEAKLGIGPPIDTGFYYDFDRHEAFVPEDLEFMNICAAALYDYPKLVPLIAHDRATFGGMLISCGFATLLPALWMLIKWAPPWAFYAVAGVAIARSTWECYSLLERTFFTSTDWNLMRENSSKITRRIMLHVRNKL